MAAILAARGDQEHPLPHHRDDLVIDPGWIAPIHDAAGQTLGETMLPPNSAQQKHPAVGQQAPAFEGGFHLLSRNRWQVDGQKAIIVHSGNDAP